MVRSENIAHPAVEVKLPLDSRIHQYVVPQDTTMFLWVALAAGTPERIPQIQSSQGSSLFRKGVQSQEQMTWSISIDGDSVPLMSDSYYKRDGYEALAWWIAFESPQLPAIISVEFEATGEQPSVQGDPMVLWTEQGNMIPWGKTVESTIELASSDSPASTFSTDQETLWNQHTVYKPKDSNGFS